MHLTRVGYNLWNLYLMLTLFTVNFIWCLHCTKCDTCRNVGCVWLVYSMMYYTWPSWHFFLKKMKIFGNFFWKNVKFLAIFWQSNGNFPEGQYYTSTRLRRLTLTGMSDLGIMLAKLPPNGTIHDFFRWDFSTFWLCEPKFTEFWTEKVHNLSHLRRI